MINQITALFEEYGWTSHQVEGETNHTTYIITYYTPDEDLTLNIPIVIFEKENWLYVSTHKLFKFSWQDKDILLKFMEYNNQTLLVKWFIRHLQDISYINVGFELNDQLFTKDNFYLYLDLLTHYIDLSMQTLREKLPHFADTLTRVNTITKESLELD